jgi:hypothetical protein
MEDIAENQRLLALRTRISVQKELFAGVELRIGELTQIVNDDEATVSFGVTLNDEELSIQMGAYQGPKRG